MTRDQLTYALAKQIPDMTRGCRIETNYGTVDLEPADSAKVAALIDRLLRKKLELPVRTSAPCSTAYCSLTDGHDGPCNALG